MSKQEVIIRKDLQEQELKVPVGDIYFGGTGKLECRWFNEDEDDERFQVKINGIWLDAYSIDFEPA